MNAVTVIVDWGSGAVELVGDRVPARISRMVKLPAIVKSVRGFVSCILEPPWIYRPNGSYYIIR
jgi:hypothetical protein